MQKMLAAQVHVGTKNMEFMMKDYIWRRRQDGIHIINIGKTWEKIQLAARIIVAVENPQDVFALSARPLILQMCTSNSDPCTNVANQTLHLASVRVESNPRRDFMPLPSWGDGAHSRDSVTG